jgi:peptide/nickel transport system substrate-binding protein
MGLAEEPDALDPTLSGTLVHTTVYAQMCARSSTTSTPIAGCPAARRVAPDLLGEQEDRDDQVAEGSQVQRRHPVRRRRVKRSLERHKELLRSRLASALLPVASIETEGEYTVIVRLSSRYAPLVAYLAVARGRSCRQLR